MLLQATTPRPVFDPAQYPEYLHIHTLAKPGVSEGTVRFSGTTDPEFGKAGGVFIEPVHTYPIEGEEGFEALEHIVPFWRLFREEDKQRNLKLVPFCSAGFGLVVKSAFRSDPRTYDEHVLNFSLLFPVTGGGIIRLGDSFFDISNSKFDPWAPNPMKCLPGGYRRNLELEMSYNRTHKIGKTKDIDKRRAARIAAAEASMRNSGTLPAADDPKLLGRG